MAEEPATLTADKSARGGQDWVRFFVPARTTIIITICYTLVCVHFCPSKIGFVLHFLVSHKAFFATEDTERLASCAIFNGRVKQSHQLFSKRASALAV
jgi:hypothetical protein